MREFYFKDKNTNKAYRGWQAMNDIDCLPFDYFRLGHAYNFANVYQDYLKVQCPVPIPDEIVRDFVLKETDKMIEDKLANSLPNKAIHQLFMDDTLSYKEQNKLLNGVVLSPTDFLWLNKEAQEMGYLMDIYHEEKYPKKFYEKKRPAFLCEKDNGTIEKMGSTNMSDGEMRALLEQRKVIQSRIYHKDCIWHCFYFTYKGIAGEENGLMGSQPHYHYLSDKSGINWNDLIQRIKTCNMPTSKVHIVIEQQGTSDH